MNKQLMILLIGRIITNIADSLYMIATIWYVKTTTDSAFLIGLTSAIAMLPVTLQFLYGPMIDRFSKRKILFFAEIGQGSLIAVISVLFFTNALWLPLLFFLMFLALALSEATYPTESALIESLSDKKDLTKVNSVFACSYQTLDIISDAISGILIVFVGLGVIYVSNSILLIGTGLLFLFYLKVPKSKKEDQTTSLKFLAQYKNDFIDGYQVIKKQHTLLNIMFGVIVINVMATMGLAMLPVISSNSAEFGFWLTAMSVGTLVGTVLASKLEHIPLNRIMPYTSLFSGVCWMVAFSQNDKTVYSYVLFGFAWIGIGLLAIFVQTIIQVNLPKGYLGIGFAFISSILGSLSPLGYFLGGLFGELSSGPLILMLSGLGYFGFTIYFLVHPKLKKLNTNISTNFG
ncbi:MFS transporter [Pseudalkalibacillus berkeleyi]|uniref:MFS transporter n=1 Tax=Pseudalkalibacillus berkeleyi TaxID=1069813 RepID=A0ABS9H389_9BACL|nr:MFS transporter [Pseudalkalibacillus berkeleyi]MCF6138263.1 MFS transporter [Pseudalkalibacillus berkeleyi]